MCVCAFAPLLVSLSVCRCVGVGVGHPTSAVPGGPALHAQLLSRSHAARPQVQVSPAPAGGWHSDSHAREREAGLVTRAAAHRPPPLSELDSDPNEARGGAVCAKHKVHIAIARAACMCVCDWCVVSERQRVGV